MQPNFNKMRLRSAILSTGSNLCFLIDSIIRLLLFPISYNNVGQHTFSTLFNKWGTKLLIKLVWGSKIK